MIETISTKNIQCAWCGVNLSNASQVKYLNGNLPVCDLCLAAKFGANYQMIGSDKILDNPGQP